MKRVSGLKKKSLLVLMLVLVLSSVNIASASSTSNATNDNTIYTFETSVFAENTKAEELINANTYSHIYLTEEEIEKELEYSERVIEKQIRYRTSNNLDASYEAIQKALNSENGRSTVPKYGVALTEEEDEYITNRDNLMEKYGKQISKLLKENGIKAYKGLNKEILVEYSDVATFHQERANGLKFVIGFSEENEKTIKLREKIEEMVPTEYLEFKKVNHSEAELVEAYETINKVSRDNDIQLAYASVDIKNNVVNVEVENMENLMNVLQESLSIKSMVSSKHNIFNIKEGKLRIQSEARTTKLDTMAGGLLIDDSSYDSIHATGAYCTIGASAKKDSNRFVVTAGHCLENWSSTIYQGGESIGTNHYYYKGDYADVGVINVNSNKKISYYVYKYSWTDGKVTSYQSSVSSLDVGDSVCLSGATTGFQCGEVTSTYTNYPGYVGYIETDIDSSGGDSGGTYWYNDVLIGIHTAGERSGPPIALFTHISYAISYGGAWTPKTNSTVE